MRVSITSPKYRDAKPFLAGLKDLPVPALVYIILVVTPAVIYVGPLYLTFLRIYALLITVPAIILALRLQNKGARLIDILFFAFVSWWALSLMNNNPDRFFQQIGSFGIEFLGGYFVGRAFIRDRIAFVSMAKWVILIIVLLTPLSIFETMTGRPLVVETISKLPGIFSLTNVNIEQRMGLERVQSVFAHPIHYGLFCSAGFSLSVLALKNVISSRSRYLLGIITAATGFLALSSGALFSFVIQFFLIIWASVFDKVRHRWWLLFALGIIAYVVVDLLSNRTPIMVFMSYATFSPHNAYWREIIFDWGLKNIFGSAIDGIPSAKLFGIGQNDWARPWYMYSGSFDNFWLLIAVQGGIPSFLFLVMGYGVGLAKVAASGPESSSLVSNIRRAWLFCFFGLSFTLSTVHIWGNMFSFLFFLFGSGLWMLKNDPEPIKKSQIGDDTAGLHDKATGYSRFTEESRTTISRLGHRTRDIRNI